MSAMRLLNAAHAHLRVADSSRGGGSRASFARSDMEVHVKWNADSQDHQGQSHIQPLVSSAYLRSTNIPDQYALVGQGHRSHPISRPQLGKQAGNMGLHRCLADVQGSREFSIAESSRELLEQFGFSRSERCQSRPNLQARVGIPLDDAAGDCRRQQRLTGKRLGGSTLPTVRRSRL